ncbi:uncharacterized protein METZ01_LOCUS303367, partial [marine metagenome]
RDHVHQGTGRPVPQGRPVPPGPQPREVHRLRL